MWKFTLCLVLLPLPGHALSTPYLTSLSRGAGTAAPSQPAQSSSLTTFTPPAAESTLAAPASFSSMVDTISTTALTHRTIATDLNAPTFHHAPLSYFSIDQLTPKGPRAGADIGNPHDATRPMVSSGTTAAGSWWCAAGGWPSPNLRPSTEVFLVLSGHGCVTDLDGQRHYFGPGDTVVLPKGWSGRWDILADLHKVWITHEHAKTEEMGGTIRARVASYQQMTTELIPQGDIGSGEGGTTPRSASYMVYSTGATRVGCGACTPGSFPAKVMRTEWFHVLEGIFFLTNPDGTAQRCAPGDTVVLPKGWAGYWDVIEPMKKLSVVLDD